MSKDLFSDQAERYALYRPQYPKELFDYILSFVEEKDCAWDCATGNGQSAVPLSEHFKKVVASDISEKQLQQAPRKENIEYIVCSAEQTPFADNSFNLIIIAQAYHWLNWEKFGKEAKRVARPGCIVSVWMYDLLHSEDPSINEVIRWFYKEVTGPYWDAERKHVDDHYANVLFPFEALPAKEFVIERRLTLEDLLGYFSSWSATQNYIKAKGSSPLDLVKAPLEKVWGASEARRFVYPIYLKLGSIDANS